MRLVLASASPRRAELLSAAGFEFDVMTSEVAEAMDPEETPDGFVRRLALEKAEAVRSRAPGRPILAADTVVLLNNEVLGKPVDDSTARSMLRKLSGREHVVLTAVCLIVPHAESGRTQTAVARTVVTMATLTEAEIEWYVASGEPRDKAGAYGVQGLASRFVTRLDGSYSNVVGLPVADVYRLCTQAGILVS
jgi:septum formation protein